MKRADNLYEILISDENIYRALWEVNRTHRTTPRHKPNETVLRIEANLGRYAEKLREILVTGFIPHEPKIKRIYDKSAGKWRDISEPKLWPDQYVHHALIQVLEPVMMRGMDYYCCGSIRGRGIHYGVKALKKWMKEDIKGTKYCMELDIHHFYESLQPDIVMARLRYLVKDARVLDLCERVIGKRILIGAYCSQWFANTVLQPLDIFIREHKCVKHYLRYMDNFTIFGSNKRELRRLRIEIEGWLHCHGMRMKDNWQIFPTDARLPNALGYRFGRGFTLLRKKNELRLKRQITATLRKIRERKRITVKRAAGLISRFGQLKYCRNVRFYELYVPYKMQRVMKNVVRYA